ncbi:MAG: F0F1 ATP synthase subunit gamma [Anaerolineae bacterium]|nr:F0F1 ATP synthase subunit gamma [Anaerolineae bacterium]
MAVTTEQLKDRIATAEDLQSIVTTMKVLSAVNLRQYERAVRSLRQYNRNIELGLRVVLGGRAQTVTLAEEPGGGRFGGLVFGSEQGMAGRFNDQIVEHTLREVERLHPPYEDWAFISLGARLTGRLQDVDLPVVGEMAMPASIAGINRLVQEALLTVERWHSVMGIDRVFLFHNRPRTSASSEPVTVQLMPVDLEWLRSLAGEPWRSRSIPMHTMDWQALFSSLIREHLFAVLFRAFAESLAGENASRLASMQAAENNIRDRLAQLRAEYRRQRQTAVTEELLDIIAGFEALTGGEAQGVRG